MVTGSERIAALAPEGFSSLAGLAEYSMTETYVAQFSRLCDIPDTVAEIREQYHISDGQITENVPLLSIEGQLVGETGANQIFQVALVLSVIVMVTCILMISSSLNSNTKLNQITRPAREAFLDYSSAIAVASAFFYDVLIT